MTNNRIRELRNSLNISQEELATKIGTTQQTISRMETSTYSIPSDLLIKISLKFNVSTDYILGIADTKHIYDNKYQPNNELEKYYDILLRYHNLSDINKKTIKCILECLEKVQEECDYEKTHKDENLNTKGVLKYAKNSNLR
ncbi:MAG: helix-turn-helix domain-containing protein [Lachnospiraceae bacterium]|nr:helix-turn-helix domain-containing protein [Lachnospiraceae bacterium]